MPQDPLAATPADQPTWSDVERAALQDPALHQLVTAVRTGLATREDALISTVLWYSTRLAEHQSRDLDRLMRAPRPPFATP